MKDQEAIDEAIRAFQDHEIDHEELYDRLVRAGCNPEEAQEMVDIECDASDD